MMHYSGLDPAAYGSNTPNVTVMNRGTTAAAMQAAWSQNPAASCRYNPAQTADYMAAAGTTFGADPVSSFYQDTYRHPLISASSAMPSVYYPTTHPMLMQSRSMTSPAELSISNPSPTGPNAQNQQQELASPTDSLGSKGMFLKFIFAILFQSFKHRGFDHLQDSIGSALFTVQLQAKEWRNSKTGSN